MRLRSGLGAAGLLGLLCTAVVALGLWHLTQGTSGVGPAELLGALAGGDATVGGVSVGQIFLGSRLPRLLAGLAVGFGLGVAGTLLQSVTRNALASPDTLAVAAGAYCALVAVAAFGVVVPLWANTLVAFAGGLAAAAMVLGLTGGAGAGATTRLILAGSAMAMALQAVTGMLLILFKENTTGLYAWGSGSLAQLSVDHSLRALPVIGMLLVAALLLARRLDALGLGDDAATALGVPVRSTRVVSVVLAVLLSGIAVTLAGPIAFVGLGAPVLARLLAARWPVLRHHATLLPTAGLLGALIVVGADVGLRAVLSAEGAASIPTGVPTALLGAVVIIVLARRMRDAGAARHPDQARVRVRSTRRFVVVLVLALVLVAVVVVGGLLSGSLMLRLGDITLWLQGEAPRLVGFALDERAPRVLGAVCAGAALALSGCAVQSTVRNPLAEPGLLGITAGAGLGAVLVVTAALPGGRPWLVGSAVTVGVLTFLVVAVLSWRGGLLPDRFVLVGIGCGYAISAITTFLLLRANPYDTPAIFTWLSGTTYGRRLPDVLPVAVVLALAIPLLFALRRRMDLLAVDDDTPRLLGLRLERTRATVLTVAAVLAAVSVVAVGVVGFVGLVAPHLARSLVGARHGRLIPVSALLGAALTGLADVLGRTLIAPSQLPAGLMIALIGAPYFVWLMRRSRRSA